MQLSLNARKAMAAGLAASTLLWAAIGVLPQVASADVHSEGCLVLSGGIVWMSTGGTRRGYTSAEVFQTYGYNFSQVVAATAEDIALPVGPIMIYADNTLVKGPSDPLVYLVTGGQKRPFVSGAVFTGLGFVFSNIQTAPANTFGDLPTGANLDSTAMAHPTGVRVVTNGTVWQMTSTGRMGFPSADAFLSYGYTFAKLAPANAADLAMPDQGAVPTRPGCTGGGPAVVPSGTVNVALAGPASTTLINDQSQATLANFVFTGSGTVTGVSLKRIGISADTSITNVYLFDGATRLTDAASVSSGSVINFTNSAGLFTVNGSRTVSVKADMAGNSGETIGVQLTALTLSSGSAGGLPISGGLHGIATASLADVNLASALTVSDTDPGNDIVVFQGNVSVTTRDVTMTRLALRQIGSINSSDIRNFDLYVDGIMVASQSSLDANGYITFNVSKTLTTGTRVIKVIADIIGGSGRNVQMSLRGAYDITVVDTQYNASPVVTATGSFPFGDSTTFGINNGTVTVAKASDSPSANVTVGASDVPLGRWTVTAFGEAVKVETLTVAVDTTGGTTSAHTLRNGRVMINGAQYGSTTAVAAVDSFASGQSFTVNYTVMPGTPATVEFRADMFDSEGDDNFVTATIITSLQTALFGSSSLNNAIPQVSLGTLDVPGATENANALTVASGTISLTELASYPDQTTAVPQTSYKLGQWTLAGNSAEAVNVNTLAVGFVGADAWDPSSDLSNVYIKYGSNTSSIKGTVADGSASALDNSWSQAFTLGVNESMNVELWGTIASSANDGGGNDTMTPYLRVTGITALSGTTVCADVDTDAVCTDNGMSGQTITAGTGQLTATTDASSPVARLVDDSGTVTTVAWKFAAVTDSFTITDLSFTLGSASAVSSVAIKDGSTTVATKAGAAAMSFSGLNIPVAANTNKVLTVELTMSPIGVGGGTSAGALTTTMDAFTSRNSSGTQAASTNGGAQSNENDPAGAVMYAYKAIPTITYENLLSTSLIAGTRTLARFTINTNGTGTIAWKQMMLELTLSGATGPALSAFSIWDVTGGANNQVTAAETIQNADNSGTATDCDTEDETCELLILVGVTIDDNVEETVNGSKTYEVRATVGGSIGTGDYVSASIETYLGHIANDDADTNENDTTVNDTTFLWSDVSASLHDTGTEDWTNDNLVKSLPTATWTLVPPT